MTSDQNTAADKTHDEHHDGESGSGRDTSDSQENSSSDTVREDGLETDVHGEVDTVS